MMIATALHTEVVPTVRAAVKTELPYQNDTIIVFFFAADKHKGNADVTLDSSKVLLRIL